MASAGKRMLVMEVGRGQELRNPLQDAVSLLLVWEVTGVGVGFVLKVGDGGLESGQLQGGSEFIAGSLQNEDGTGDTWEKVFEREDFTAESGGPLRPGGKDVIWMLVVMGKALLQFAPGIVGSHLVDEFAGDTAGDDERALEDERTDTGGDCCVEERDAGAFAVAVEDGVGYGEVVEERGDDGVDLVEEVVVRALGEGTFGVAVAGAGVGEDVVVGCEGELVRKLFPVADGAESFVEEKDRALRGGEREVGDLGALAVERELEVLGAQSFSWCLGHRDSIQMTLVCDVSHSAKRGE
jgi:hypothetical protein